MYRAMHESGIANQMVAHRHAQADMNRLAALARGGRGRRRSLVGRIGGRLATMTALVRHHTVTRDGNLVTRDANPVTRS